MVVLPGVTHFTESRRMAYRPAGSHGGEFANHVDNIFAADIKERRVRRFRQVSHGGKGRQAGQDFMARVDRPDRTIEPGGPADIDSRHHGCAADKRDVARLQQALEIGLGHQTT